LEYRVYAALLLDVGVAGRSKINRLHPSRHASPNRLKTGLRTGEETLAAVSYPLQRFNFSTLQLPF